MSARTFFRIPQILIVSAILSYPGVVWGCEPVAVWVVFAGPGFLPLSLSGLIGVVLIKCTAFPLFERRLPAIRGFLYMFAGNVISTLSGLALGFPFLAPVALFFAIPFLLLICFGCSIRLAFLFGRKLISGFLFFFLLVLCFFVTGLLFGLAQGALGESQIVSYWLLKLGYVGVAFVVSIGITTLLEEWIISGLSGKRNEAPTFLPAVLKANLAAFLLGAGVAAGYMLPKRMSAPGFLVDLMELVQRTFA